MSEIPLKVLYQDSRYIAIDKPSGLLVHRSPVDKSETRFCIQMLRDQIGQRVYPCHRLDKPTSGVLLFALDKVALSAANELFANHQVIKQYHAIVRGWIDGSGTIDHPLKDIEEGGVSRGGGEAVTEFHLRVKYEVQYPVGPYPTGRYSLVELRPKTGRMHQLRRHMKHAHHHIIGDTRYGDGVHNRYFREHFGCRRLLLQATSLSFPHPFNDEITTISTNAGLPDFGIPLPIAT